LLLLDSVAAVAAEPAAVAAEPAVVAESAACCW